jgi:hypothetical protein
VLVTVHDRPAHGRASIAQAALTTWHGDRTYIALVVAQGSINVVRRGGDGAWRYAIVHVTEEE